MKKTLMICRIKTFFESFHSFSKVYNIAVKYSQVNQEGDMQ